MSGNMEFKVQGSRFKVAAGPKVFAAGSREGKNCGGVLANALFQFWAAGVILAPLEPMHQDARGFQSPARRDGAQSVPRARLDTATILLMPSRNAALR